MNFVKSQPFWMIATFFPAVILGLALAFLLFGTAFSQTEVALRGPYMIAGGDKMMVWRVDQATGRVSYCMRDSVSTDPQYLRTRAPYCSAWSQ